MSHAQETALRYLGSNPGALIGYENRERVRAYLQNHIGATNIECGAALGLSVYSVGRHIKALRREWQEGSE